MSLYDGLDIDKEEGGSGTKPIAAGWSSSYKFLKSQLQTKKANVEKPKRSKQSSTLAPVVDLKRSVDVSELHFNMQTGRLEPVSKPEPVAVGGSPFIASDPLPSLTGVADEYDPLRPNDYEEIVKKRKEQRQRDREEDDRRREREREREDFENRGRKRPNRDRDWDESRNNVEFPRRHDEDRKWSSRDRDWDDSAGRNKDMEWSRRDDNEKKWSSRDRDWDNSAGRNKDMEWSRRDDDEKRRRGDRDQGGEMERAKRRREEEEEEEFESRLASAGRGGGMGGTAIAPPSSLLEDVDVIREEPDRSRSPPLGAGFGAGSVASKIMAKYGYREGQGLGKSEQGMSTALYVEKTSKRGGKIIHEKDIPKEPPREPATNTNLMRNPSKVVLLQNMVGPGEVDEDLEPETFEECGKYGKVVKCLIFEMPDASDDEAVRIFVEFEKMDAAIKAVIDLNGRFFGGRVVKGCFYNLDKFRRLDLADSVD